MNRFFQIHTLTSYPASLLNRDDAGSAKRISFGGTVRTRISSQCLKRHWRTYNGEHALLGIEGVEASVRSRYTFEQEVYAKLASGGADADRANTVVAAMMPLILGKNKKGDDSEGDDGSEDGGTEGDAGGDEVDESEKQEGKKPKSKKVKKGEASAGAREQLMTKQITVFGRPELAFFATAGAEILESLSANGDAKKAVEAYFKVKGQKENLQALKLGAGLDAALFGRMVTSDTLARCDAAIHVAHAFTVHEEASESDYFSAVDDLLKGAGATGSGHINSAELTTGLFYGYVCVDVPLLISNLSGDRALAGEVLARLVHTVATVSPGAKLGSTAPHAFAQVVLAEVGKSQPRTLANAYFDAVKPRDFLLGTAYEALARHVREIDEMYDLTTERALAAIGPREKLANVLPAPVSIAQVAEFARRIVK